MATTPFSQSFLFRTGLVATVIVTLLVGDRILGAMLEMGTKHSLARLPKAYTGRLDGDVWILGNSRGAKSFDLESLGEASNRKFVNLSVNGLRPSLLHALANDALSANRTPESVWIEVSYLKNDWDDALAGEFLPYASQGEATNALLYERLPKQAFAADCFALRRFGGQQYFRSLLFLRRDDQKDAMRKTISDVAIESMKAQDPEEFQINEQSLKELAQFIDRLESESVSVRLVLAPYFPAYRSKITNLESWLKHIEDELECPIEDASAALTDRKYFADHVHLNRSGQVHFSSLMSQP